MREEIQAKKNFLKSQTDVLSINTGMRGNRGEKLPRWMVARLKYKVKNKDFNFNLYSVQSH